DGRVADPKVRLLHPFGDIGSIVFPLPTCRTKILTMRSRCMRVEKIDYSRARSRRQPMATQTFTRNHRDHSNDTGFQFEFFCDKCGNGHRSSFQTSGMGVAASMLKAAGALFGGGMSRVGYGADHVKDALRGPAW